MFFWGASLSEPTLIMTTPPARGIIVCMYVCMYVRIYLSIYHLLCVCRTLVPEICVRPEMLRVFLYLYIDVLTCVHLQLH